MGCFSSKSNATKTHAAQKKTKTLLDDSVSKSCKPAGSMQDKEIANIARVQELVAEFMAGRPDGYLAGVADDMKGSVLGGLVPGGECFKNKAEFANVMGEMDKYMEVKKFEPCNWRAVGDDVLFNVNWEFVWKASGKMVTATALVRKVVKNNLICEKYHMLDVEAVTGEKQEEAPNVKRVKELLAEFMAGRPDGYMVGVADEVKASMLAGLIPGADCIASKADFAKVMADIDTYMEVKKFEPYNFHSLPNDDMMFNVDWEFAWKPTGKMVTTTAIVRKVLKENMICEKYHMLDVEQITELQQIANIKRVQELVAEFMAGRPEGYLAGVADDIKGSVLGGLIPGGDCFRNKAEFAKLMGEMDKHMEVKKFEPCNWHAVGDDVLFNVDWEFVWKASGKTVSTTALVRKVVKNNLICEKYHMVDAEEVTGEKQGEATTVKRVKELLAEFKAGRPEGYMSGVADNVKASMLRGLIPGAGNIRNKSDFAKVMGSIDNYMEVKKFEPCNFHALPNDDMMFNVNWEFVWKPTGQSVKTTAIVRKVLKDNKICEKYHMVDVTDVLYTTV